jgi:hypothetical protein
MAKGQQIVLAFFDTEDLADQAAAHLKDWDKASEDIRLGAIGVLVKDDKGKIKTHKLGARAGKKGAGVGVILGIIAAILSGGVTLLGGLVGGAMLGGVLGSFVKKGLDLSKEDLARIGAELDGGHAAVGVLVDASEVQLVSDELGSLGGRAEAHAVSEETLEHADAAVAEAPAEEPVAEAPAAEAPAGEAPAAEEPAAA